MSILGPPDFPIVRSGSNSPTRGGLAGLRTLLIPTVGMPAAWPPGAKRGKALLSGARCRRGDIRVVFRESWHPGVDWRLLWPLRNRSGLQAPVREPAVGRKPREVRAEWDGRAGAPHDPAIQAVRAIQVFPRCKTSGYRGTVIPASAGALFLRQYPEHALRRAETSYRPAQGPCSCDTRIMGSACCTSGHTGQRRGLVLATLCLPTRR